MPAPMNPAVRAGSKQVSGQPCVLADDHAMSVRAAHEQQPGGLSESQAGPGRHGIDIGCPPDAVGAEQSSRLLHVSQSLVPEKSER